MSIKLHRCISSIHEAARDLEQLPYTTVYEYYQSLNIPAFDLGKGAWTSDSLDKDSDSALACLGSIGMSHPLLAGIMFKHGNP
jgi:hypothetical protein